MLMDSIAKFDHCFFTLYFAVIHNAFRRTHVQYAAISRKYRKGYPEDILKEAVDIMNRGAASGWPTAPTTSPRLRSPTGWTRRTAGHRAGLLSWARRRKRYLLRWWSCCQSGTSSSPRVTSGTGTSWSSTSTRKVYGNLPNSRFVDTFLGRHAEFTLRKTTPSSAPGPLSPGRRWQSFFGFWHFCEVCWGSSFRKYVQFQPNQFPWQPWEPV